MAHPESHAAPSGKAALSAPRKASRPTPARSLEVMLEGSQPAVDRLLNAARIGTDEFVLTSRDGRTSVQVRLTVTNVPATFHRLNQGTVSVDWSRSTISRDSDQVSLSRTELRLLAALIDANGKVVSRDQLIARVWPNDGLPPVERANALSVYVWALRKRLAAIGAQDALETVRGVGYRVLL
jgi:DNA-binding response OmpR family regulator